MPIPRDCPETWLQIKADHQKLSMSGACAELKEGEERIGVPRPFTNKGGLTSEIEEPLLAVKARPFR